MRMKMRMTLPVLFRELVQLASRRGTYITRVACSLVLYGFSLVLLYNVLQRLNRGSSIGLGSVLGNGKMVLMTLHGVVVAGCFLILPAMVVSTITTERENGTLDLMLVTRLNPWEIVLQKLFARLVPVTSLLLLAAPIMAVAYSLGGVSSGDIMATLLGWLQTSLQLGSLALMCSAIAGSTVSAFFLTYAMIFGLTVGTQILGIIGTGWFFGMVIGVMGPGNFMGMTAAHRVIAHVCSLGLVLSFIAIARSRIVRPGRRSSGGAKSIFRRLDGAMERINSKFGRVRWGATATLPDERPVAWREKAAAVVHTPRHRFRLLMLINIPVGFVLLLIMANTRWTHGGEEGAFSVLMAILWVPVTLAICIYVSNLISKERANQTLDVLLTTPLTERDILRQKLAAVPPLCLVLASPLILTVLLETLYEFSPRGSSYSDDLAYPFLSLLFMGIYLYSLTWITFSCSIKRKKRARVVAAALGRVFAIVLIPFVVASLFTVLNMRAGSRVLHSAENLMMMSPMYLLGMLEFSRNRFFDLFPAACVNAGLFLGMTLVLRARALRWARLHLREG